MSIAPVEPEPASGSWGADDALRLVAVVVLLGLAERLALESSLVRSLDGVGLLGARVAIFSAFYGCIVGVLAWFARGRPLAEAVALRRFDVGRGVIDAAAVALLSVVFQVALIVVLMRLGVRLPPARDVLEFFGPTPAGIVAIVLLAVLAGPLVEEMVFRGAVLPGLASMWGNGWGVVGSALLFSLVHLDLARVIPVAFLGVFLARLRLRHDSLWPPVIAHALFNGLVLALTLASRG